MQNKKKSRVVIEDVAYYLVMLVLAAAISILSTVSVMRDFSILKNVAYIIEVTLVVFMVLVIMFIYQMYIIKPKERKCSRVCEFTIVYSILFIVVIISSLLFSFYSPYAVPIAAISLLISVLLHQRIGIMSSICTFMILVITCPTTIMLYKPEAFSISSYGGLIVSLISGIIMTFLVHNGYTRLKMTWGAIFIGIGMIPLGIVFGALEQNANVSSVILLGIISFLGSLIAVGITTVVLPIYESIFRVWTDFKLAEICSLNAKWLKILREEAPGTYSHCITVSNMAENCAIAIGLNPFMARACGLYHDIGKIENPQFFVENQSDGYNPHDELIIDVSVKIITEHTEDGAAILKKANMPLTVIKAALEHHGDSTLMYFYLKAKGITEGDLAADEYRYNGPKPSTKYSAVVMICDICEAITRAKPPESQEDLENLVNKIITEKILDGQFSDCNISLQDLSNIKKTICEVIPAMLHKRIDYDKAKERR